MGSPDPGTLEGEWVGGAGAGRDWGSAIALGQRGSRGVTAEEERCRLPCSSSDVWGVLTPVAQSSGLTLPARVPVCGVSQGEGTGSGVLCLQRGEAEDSELARVLGAG